MESPLGPEQTGDSGRASRPVVGGGFQLLLARFGQGVVLGTAPAVRHPPLGVEGTGALEPSEGGQQRTGIDFEYGARNLLHPARDPEPVHGFEGKRLQNEEVKGTRNDVGVEFVHRGLRYSAPPWYVPSS